jgi:hypothetical protein
VTISPQKIKLDTKVKLPAIGPLPTSVDVGVDTQLPKVNLPKVNLPKLGLPRPRAELPLG